MLPTAVLLTAGLPVHTDVTPRWMLCRSSGPLDVVLLCIRLGHWAYVLCCPGASGAGGMERQQQCLGSLNSACDRKIRRRSWRALSYPILKPAAVQLMLL